MNNSGLSFFSAAAGLALFLCSGSLQGAPDQPATGPWLSAAPEFSSWKIEITRPGTVSVDDPLLALLNPLKSEEVTKSGDIAKLKRTWADGRQTEGWSFNGLRIVNLRNLPADRFTIEKPPVGSTDPAPAGAGDFPELAWVGAENYRGVVMFEGKPCRLHEASVVWQTDAPEPVQVWISDESRLPIAIEGQGVRWKYTFAPTSAVTLVVPPAVEKRYHLYRRGMHR